MPLLRFTRGASTPGGCPPSELRFHPQFSFRPRGSSPPRRFPPRCGRRCIATGAGRGSPRFRGDSTPTRSVTRSSRREEPSTSPRRTSHPSKNPRPEHSRARATHPPKQPFRVSATVAPVPFSRLRGFAPLRGPASAAPPLPVERKMLVLPWVLFPSGALAALRGATLLSRGSPRTSHRSRGVCSEGAPGDRCRSLAPLGFLTSKSVSDQPFRVGAEAPVGLHQIGRAHV